MYSCSLFTPTIDLVLELKGTISTTLLHEYRKYNHIKYANKISRKSALLNENPIRSQTSNGKCNAEYTIIECLDTI